ncbi:MAG: gamma-glutamylcyclotransferase family protein [Rubrobacteraceae bacterium]
MDKTSLFVYGTLKRGFPAHERVFQGENEVAEAFVRGELYDLPAGYPALIVPKKDILAFGTDDRRSDAKAQAERVFPPGEAPGPEESVHGEIILFGDPERTLSSLDEFEGFDPDGESLYLRALLPAWTASGKPRLVWTYVVNSPAGTRLPGGRWPP